MSPNVTDDEVGKRVVNANGDEVGVVSAVEGDRLRVDPDPGITDSIKAALGWESTPEDAYAIEADAVDSIADDEVRLRGDLPGRGDATRSGGAAERDTDPTVVDRDEGAGGRDAGPGTSEIGESEADRTDESRGTGPGEPDEGTADERGTGSGDELGREGGADPTDPGGTPPGDESSRGAEVDPTEVTDPGSEIRPEEDVGDRADAAVDPGSDARRTDASVDVDDEPSRTDAAVDPESDTRRIDAEVEPDESGANRDAEPDPEGTRRRTRSGGSRDDPDAAPPADVDPEDRAVPDDRDEDEEGERAVTEDRGREEDR